MFEFCLLKHVIQWSVLSLKPFLRDFDKQNRLLLFYLSMDFVFKYLLSLKCWKITGCLLKYLKTNYQNVMYDQHLGSCKCSSDA